MCSPQRPQEDWKSHPNEAWWASQVLFASVQEVPEKQEEDETEQHYKFIGEGANVHWVKIKRVPLTRPPDLPKHMDKVITAFTEIRQPYWKLQPHSWITYHAFIILELNMGEMYVMLERKTDMLEIVIGDFDIPMGFMKAFRAIGPGRNPGQCLQEPRVELSRRVTLRMLFKWIDGPVEERWVPYDILKANCQHFAEDVQAFLLDPNAPEHRTLNPLNQFRSNVKDKKSFFLAVVEQIPRALKYLPLQYRRDEEIVQAALTVDGSAIRYASLDLRKDLDIVLTAVTQNGYALPYVHPSIRQDRKVVQAAVQQNGYVLCYCVERHRVDKEIALIAVHQDAYALRYVGRELRRDPEILFAAGLQNPVALARAMLLF